MSSVRSLFTSRQIAAAERRLSSVGRVADDNSSAAFAVKPASAAQDPGPDAPPPSDPIVVTIDVVNPVPVTQTEQATAADLNAANATIPPAPTNYDVATMSQAARAYAQVMQAWLGSKRSRSGAG